LCTQILACDGLWDIMQPQQAVDFVAGHLGQTALTDVARALVEEALKKGSTDNITAMVVVFQGDLTPHK
jgi:serine/threonine protein phosphatase PrpC